MWLQNEKYTLTDSLTPLLPLPSQNKKAHGPDFTSMQCLPAWVTFFKKICFIFYSSSFTEKWGEGTEISHRSLAPTHVLPLLSTS